jgi:hypothetical protein
MKTAAPGTYKFKKVKGEDGARGQGPECNQGTKGGGGLGEIYTMNKECLGALEYFVNPRLAFDHCCIIGGMEVMEVMEVMDRLQHFCTHEHIFR